MQKIGIIGASGWLGRHLTECLLERGDLVVGFSRKKQADNRLEWRQWDGEESLDLSGLDSLVNLAGESIQKRWTAKNKVKFHDSRVGITEKIVSAMELLSEGERPKRFLNASAVGVFGDRGDELLNEQSDIGKGYLADLCAEWEDAASAASVLGVPTVFLRTGVVLGEGGGAWPRLAQIFKLGLGGRLGSGDQWFPWIHLRDEIAAIEFCLDQQIIGPVNLVAPGVVRNRDFTESLASYLERPAFFHAPRFALKIILRDFAEEALLASQRVVPENLEKAGFDFRFPDLQSALENLEC